MWIVKNRREKSTPLRVQQYQVSNSSIEPVPIKQTKEGKGQALRPREAKGRGRLMLRFFHEKEKAYKKPKQHAER